MQTPQINHVEFLVLSVLVDGRELTRKELLAVLEWEFSHEYLSRTLREFRTGGLVRKFDVLQYDEEHRSQRRQVFAVTEAGKQVWREVADFYLFVIDRFGQVNEPAADNGHAGRVISRREEPVRREAVRIRPPSVQEERQILQAAVPEFALLYRALKLTRAFLWELVALQISNVDLTAETLVFSKRTVRMDDELLDVFLTAIGGRKAGAVFVDPCGKTWSKQGFSHRFRDLCEAAGVPQAVQLRALHSRRPLNQPMKQRRTTPRKRPRNGVQAFR